jgi:hypothetical protein
MNAVAADIMACVANYGRGGIDALPAPALHEQMNDPDWEMSADEICHIAINVVCCHAGQYRTETRLLR